MHRSESYKKPVGRSATGARKVVAQLNISRETNLRLAEYSLKSSRSKSSIADEAISEYIQAHGQD